jgi:predicted  nucleic acid-binding Zn-ribbon protein
MGRDNDFNVRRCAHCDRDWPPHQDYNLCPRCQRNTFHSTAEEPADRKVAEFDANRYAEIRAFDAAADAAAQQRWDEWVADMELLLERTPSIPDPTEQEYDDA